MDRLSSELHEVSLRAHGAKHAELGIEGVAILLEVRDAKRVGVKHRTGIGRLFFKKQPKESRLPAAVRTKQTEASLRRHKERKLRDHGSVTVGFADFFRFHQLLRAAAEIHELKLCALRGVAVTHFFGEGREIVSALDACFLFGGSGLGAPAQPLGFPAKGVTQFEFRAGLGGEESLFRLEEREVVSAHAEETVGKPSIEFDDAVGNFLEKHPVVGNRYGGKGGSREKTFQPKNAFHVEMVGGLIKKEEIRLPQKLPRERHSLFPASGKLFDRAIGVFVEFQLRD